MKTSRKEGLMVMQTIKPYKMAIGGKFEPRNEIICKEPDSKAEGSVYTIEDMFLTAMGHMPQRNASDGAKAQWAKDEKKMISFYENDCPSDKEIKEQADMLMLLFRMNTAEGISTTSLMKAFVEVIKSGAVMVTGEEPMTEPRWNSIDRADKVRIAFWYCAFFVKPLAILQNMDSLTESQGSSEAVEEPQTP